ncbi:trypco2 family protein [Geodermatophilus sp. SYSU D00814]
MTTEDARGFLAPVTLNEAIGELRRELAASVLSAQDEGIRFEVGEIEVEFSVTVEREIGASGGVKFWVVNAEANATSNRSATHRILVPLTPRTPGGGPLLTGRD